MKKLTIGIPTYNRLLTLQKTVESVLKQVEKYKNDINIFISNNCSTDGTDKYLIDLKSKYDFIDYDNLLENRGPDGNFLNILNKSNSEYVHILSDDDILIDGSLDTIMEKLKNNSLGLIFLNSAVFYREFDFNNLSQYHKTYDIDDDVITTSKDVFIDIVKLEFTFLSSLIFNKECFLKISCPSNYLNTNWFQSYVALACTKFNSSICIIKDVCIAQRQLTTSPSFNPFLVFGPNLKQLLNFAVDCGYSRKKLFSLYNKRCLTMYRSIGKYKIDKKKLFKDFKPMFKVTYRKIRFWFFLYPWLFIPRFIYVLARRKYFSNKN